MRRPDLHSGLSRRDTIRCIIHSINLQSGNSVVTMPETPVILHICEPADHQSALHSGAYVCGSLASEGFIHCCTQGQLAGVVERYYSGRDDLLLLEIDSSKLQSKLVNENTVGGEELFPHVYGPINLDAVVSVTSLE